MVKTPAVAIVYGFAEGGWHGRGLSRSLRANGFRVTNNLKAADIIIGHSAGCYLIPTTSPATLVLHVGYTYWPGRKLLDSLRDNLQLERRQHGFTKWFIRCVINDLYMLNIFQTYRMYKGWRQPGLFLDALSTGRHIFVRSQHDSYCEPGQLLERTKLKHSYVSIIGGNHNDLWDNPQLYVDLLQSVYDAR